MRARIYSAIQVPRSFYASRRSWTKSNAQKAARSACDDGAAPEASPPASGASEAGVPAPIPASSQATLANSGLPLARADDNIAKGKGVTTDGTLASSHPAAATPGTSVPKRARAEHSAKATKQKSGKKSRSKETDKAKVQSAVGAKVAVSKRRRSPRLRVSGRQRKEAKAACRVPRNERQDGKAGKQKGRLALSPGVAPSPKHEPKTKITFMGSNEPLGQRPVNIYSGDTTTIMGSGRREDLNCPQVVASSVSRKGPGGQWTLRFAHLPYAMTLVRTHAFCLWERVHTLHPGRSSRVIVVADTLNNRLCLLSQRATGPSPRES